MQVIQLHHPYQPTEIVQEPIVLALGFFDGVHLGHQQVIKTAKKIADEKGLPLAVMTFNQHPKIVFSPMDEQEMRYLTTVERKKELLEELGVDILYLIHFTYDFGTQSPQTFVDDYMVGLNAQVVVAGFDYTYGPKGQTNMNTLIEHAKGRFEVISVPQQSFHQTKISSTRIRNYLSIGQIEKANKLLGTPYQTDGVVVHGLKRGRQMGYPTANIDTKDIELLPGIGVYVVKIKVKDQWYKGIASIGYNITFDSETGLTCEVYILDFDDMIYGEQVQIHWLHYLRGEVKFDGMEGLIKQLDKDAVATRKYFEKN